MNPRDIPECIEPLKELEIEKVWFRAFTQRQVEREIRRFVGKSDYDRYILFDDDAIVTKEALDNILRLQPSFDILTGWCNLSPKIWRANVMLRPVGGAAYYRLGRRVPRFLGQHLAALISGGVFPFRDIYEQVTYGSFPSCASIVAQADEVFQTFFMGGPLLSMGKEEWLRYNFESPKWGGPAFGADMALALQITRDGRKMWCARDSFCYHLKTVKNFLVGKVEPQVISELREPAQIEQRQS